MLRARIIKGVLVFEVDLRAFSSIARLIAVGLVDAWSWGMHPASPYQPILLRNKWERPL